MKQLFFALSLTVCLQLTAFAQTATPSQTPPEDDNDVVKISTSLIQIDVTAIDKDGRQITDLKPEDFEIYENGKKQEITNFSYVPVTNEAKNAVAAEKRQKPAGREKYLPPAPVKLKPEQVRRTIALVVDDIGLSFEGIFVAKQALKKFVNEQMQPNDLVAVIYTSSGNGALQQFTSDKRLLLLAIDKLKLKSGRVYAFTPDTPNARGQSGDAAVTSSHISSSQATSPDAVLDRKTPTDVFTQDQKHTFAVGMLGAINFLVRGMNELPGRKAIVLFSEGFRMNKGQTNDTSDFGKLRSAMRILTESANRAGVIINTIDTRGVLNSYYDDAQDYNDASGTDAAGFSNSRNALEATKSERRNELFETQSSLIYLAKETGGRALRNNGFFEGLRDSVNDLNGYYLLGYAPEEATFDAKTSRFNNFEIRVKRPGVKVSYRSGFFGISDDKYRGGRNLTEKNVISALFSPFGSKDIGLNMTSIFAGDAKDASIVRALLGINAKDLVFVDENGGKKADFELYAYTFGESGNIVDSFAKGYSLSVSKEEHQKMLEKGLVYRMDVPVKKAGAYQLRIALKDKNGGKIGSSSQFIEVPNLKAGKLVLSGLVLQNFTERQWRERNQNIATAANAQTATATRKFSQGNILLFNYAIYNPKRDGGGNSDLQFQTRVFRDGNVVFESQPAKVDSKNRVDLKRIETEGAVLLGMPAGEYVLQVIVFDNLAEGKKQVAAQWIDFEIAS